MLTLRHLAKSYVPGKPVLNDVNLDIAARGITAIIGPSGTGKSTLIRCINRLVEPSAGQIEFEGVELVGLSRNALRRVRRRIGMVFQEYNLVERLTVMENVLSGRLGYVSPWRAWRRKFPPDDIERAFDLLGVVGLAAFAGSRADSLSGGQRQRVALGRALIRQPRVFLMDEPLSNLDAGLRVQMRAELSRLHERFRVTTLYVTHDQVEAMTMGDRIAVMNSGRLQQVDAPETLYDNPANVFVAGFIGSPRMNFVPGRLTTAQGAATVEFLGVKTSLSARAKLTADASDGEVTVGLRPEDLMWRRAASPESRLTLNAEVDVVEPMGHEAYVTAVCAGETVTSRFPPRSGVRTRERIELALNPARLHLFDAGSGNTILQRPVAVGAELPSSVGEARNSDSAER
ncbi:MAG: ABC transporter ATP-binding protein, partial [Betaproteobacteria bacterium]